MYLYFYLLRIDANTRRGESTDTVRISSRQFNCITAVIKINPMYVLCSRAQTLISSDGWLCFFHLAESEWVSSIECVLVDRVGLVWCHGCPRCVCVCRVILFSHLYSHRLEPATGIRVMAETVANRLIELIRKYYDWKIVLSIFPQHFVGINSTKIIEFVADLIVSKRTMISTVFS